MARLKWDMPACPGIYCIEHVASGRKYIGSTRNLRKRLREHRLSLRAGKHFSPYLQRSFAKHGEAAFSFYPLETCLDNALILIAREQVWIDRFKSKLFNSRSSSEQFSSEWARSEEAKAVHAEHGKKVAASWLRRPSVEVRCQECGKLFLSRAPDGCRAKYCSRNCSMKEETRQGKRHEIRVCAHCGSEFRTARYTKVRCCSAACAQRSRSKIKEEDVVPIIERFVAGEFMRLIAASYGVPDSVIVNLVYRKSFKDVPLPASLEAALQGRRRRPSG